MLSCLKSGVEFDMNDILYEFKNLHHFLDSLTSGVNAVFVCWNDKRPYSNFTSPCNPRAGMLLPVCAVPSCKT